MKINQVRWCTLNKLEIRLFSIRYEHATVRWYTLSYGKVSQNFVLFYTFDLS